MFTLHFIYFFFFFLFFCFSFYVCLCVCIALLQYPLAFKVTNVNRFKQPNCSNNVCAPGKEMKIKVKEFSNQHWFQLNSLWRYFAIFQTTKSNGAGHLTCVHFGFHRLECKTHHDIITTLFFLLTIRPFLKPTETCKEIEKKKRNKIISISSYLLTLAHNLQWSML